jgi:hypothetical protein
MLHYQRFGFGLCVSRYEYPHALPPWFSYSAPPVVDGYPIAFLLYGDSFDFAGL